MKIGNDVSDKLKYICKECGVEDYADSYEQIIAYSKLCSKCLSDKNSKTAKIKEVNKTRYKIRKTQKEHKCSLIKWTCSKCNFVHNRASKPWCCNNPENCDSRHFFPVHTGDK